MQAMQKDLLIALDEFCASHKIEISFVRSLEQNGLIEIRTLHETGFIDLSQVSILEKYIRFYYEMDINLEGIETISYLLRRISVMQDEITLLRNRLRLYES
jgi:hypothetical protein